MSAAVVGAPTVRAGRSVPEVVVPGVPRQRAAAGPSVIALDIGVGFISGAVMTADGRVRESERWYTRPDRGPDAVVDTVLGCAAHLVDLAARRGTAAAAAGIAVLGSVDRGAGTVSSVELGWVDLPLRSWLEEHLEVPVALGHAGHAGAVAESRLGAGRGCAAFAFVTSRDPLVVAVVRGGRPAEEVTFSAAWSPQGSGTGALRSEDAGVLAGMITAAGAERVVIGGSGPPVGAALVQMFGNALDRVTEGGRRPEVVAGELGCRAASLGVAMMAQELADGC
ncbi:ROK family protein [Kitasatospora sp. NPDC049258]|uniref:ROK family protein n=1 Tax=Kitasatospora sp. NPDC049258 TaxID=3155394 RepID=UPI003448F59D